MKKSPVPDASLVLALFAVAACASPLAAQGDGARSSRAVDWSDSHVRIPSDGNLMKTEMALRLRLQQAEAQGVYQQLLHDPMLLHDPQEYLAKHREQLQALAKDFQDRKLKLNPDDPLMGSLDRLLKQPEDASAIASQLPPEVRQMVERYQKENRPRSKRGASADQPGTNREDGGSATEGAHGAQPAGPGTPSPEKGARAAAPAPEPEPNRTSSPFGRWLLRQVESVGRSEAFRNSPAIRRAIEDLSRYRVEMGIARETREGGLTDRLATMAEGLSPQRLFSGINWKPLGLPSLRRLEMPRVSLPGGSGPSSFDVHSSGPGLRSGLFALLAALVFGALLWKLGERVSARGTSQDPEKWRLGPWPVAPASVASREDFIKAFEYLSLLKLGPRARAWNHRHIAARLGEHAGRLEDADHLARLYEQARYAPDPAALPDNVLQIARRELCDLAEAPAA
jgi:hypothetical protein